MNRTIRDAAVKRYHYDTHDQLRQRLADVVAAYNFDRRLKTLKGPHALRNQRQNMAQGAEPA